MKSFLSGNHNAMLLACYRMRMRPATVLSAFILLLIIQIFTLLHATIIMFGDFNNVVNEMLVVTYSCQCLVMFLGAVRAGASVRQERISGTLAFHRVSPQSRLAIVMGLLIGAPILEWILASVLLPGVVLLGFLSGFSILDICIYECALILSALTISLFFIVVVLQINDERLKSTGSFLSNGMAFLVLYMLIFTIPSFSMMGAAENNYSACYHAFTPYFFFRIVEQAFSKEISWIPLNIALGIQLSVQIPLLCLGFWLAVRRLKSPDSPLLSKAQAYAVVLFAFALYLAELINNFAGESAHPEFVLGLAPLSCFMGLFGAFMTSPNRLLVIRGKCLKSGGGLAAWRRFPLSDSASCLFWLIGYSILTYLMTVVIWLLFNTLITNFYVSNNLSFLLVACGFVLAQVACFGGLYERFLLGRFHKSASLFAVFIFILWIVIPLFGLFFEEGSVMYWVGLVFSPIIASPTMVINYGGSGFTTGLQIFLWSGIVINLLLAFVFFSSVMKLRKRLK